MKDTSGLRRWLPVGLAAFLASCTSVASLAPEPSGGRYLDLMQELMAESARQSAQSRAGRAERAVDAVAVWRGGADGGTDEGSE